MPDDRLPVVLLHGCATAAVQQDDGQAVIRHG